jgi:phage terminase small subunit
MAILDNPQHERFAIEVAKGCASTEAYKNAGYACEGSAAWAAASRLLRNVKVQARIAELKERAALRAEITVQQLIDHAEAARQMAMSTEQPSAAVAAIKEMGILAGLRIEKSERRNTNDVRRFTDDELDAALADALAREEAEAGCQALLN